MVAVLKGWTGLSVVGGLALLLLLGACPAPAEPVVPDTRPAVTAVEQAARDDERLRILLEEKRQSEQAVEALARRRAERLAASDSIGADEAQAQRARLLQDIDALKREIGSAQRQAGLPGPLPSNAATLPGTQAKPATVKQAPPAARWWDVYTRATPASAKPVSLATPSGADATRHSTTRRLE
jgi:hypothetical protein